MKIIIVGAVAGGATVASQIRRLDADAEIVIYEKDRDMSYANCGLPYYIGETVGSRDNIVMATPDAFNDNRNIQVHTYHEVTRLFPEEKKIEIYNHRTDETQTDTYDYLILSPGASQVVPDLYRHDHVFQLRNLEDTDKIDQYIRRMNAKRALVVGGGYISLEMAENLKHRGLDVTLVHRSSHFLKQMSRDITDTIPQVLEDNGINLKLEDEVVSINERTVTFKSGDTETFDIIITALGLKPNTKFIGDALELNNKGYIKVNPYFETSNPSIFALGDAIETFYRHVDQKATIALAWGTHRAASIIAHNLFHQDKEAFKGLLGSNILRLFDHTYASVGLPETLVLEMDNIAKVSKTQKYKAGYMPYSTHLTMTVYYEQSTGKILSASAAGKSGVDKRIDVVSTAMIGGLTIYDFKDIEVAYHPDYSSPKDIINMLGYKAK
ncbi:CoA-disulfide reductase [Macrococcoides canis]|uniref:CoA-disulfide reductase n=1 Tax=Macrococcoides canis TaxID=1855823 RepID=UPI00165E7167|nr:CoA-disulfide reductase [Macrococcus canis]QNR07431.1 CoA-disulfide reductase [Macrococcus canis]